MSKEALETRRAELQRQLSEVNSELESMSHAQRLADALEWVGKYFKEKQEHNKNYHVAVFVCGVDEKNCELKSISVSYWEDQDDFYQIESTSTFNPNRWEEDRERWIEIDKIEFMHVHDEAQKRAKNMINMKV